MNTVTDNASTFTAHLLLAMRWVRWNGGKGTEKQALKVVNQINFETLTRMCVERGIESQSYKRGPVDQAKGRAVAMKDSVKAELVCDNCGRGEADHADPDYDFDGCGYVQLPRPCVIPGVECDGWWPVEAI